jgi:hypothetical protein
VQFQIGAVLKHSRPHRIRRGGCGRANTPSLRVAGFEDEDEAPHESVGRNDTGLSYPLSKNYSGDDPETLGLSMEVFPLSSIKRPAFTSPSSLK